LHEVRTDKDSLNAPEGVFIKAKRTDDYNCSRRIQFIVATDIFRERKEPMTMLRHRLKMNTT
jgi:hypothetical protein